MKQDFVLYLGGTGPISNEIRERIKERGLGEKVKMLGYVSDEDLPLVYRAADLTVVPSQSLEGFGLIAVESLASGTPVYVTPVGGLPDIVLPFAAQCVFENTRPEAISMGLKEAIRTEHPIPSDESCRAYAVDGFSWPKIATRIQSVYQEALN
jgi:glycosyltransferase involved in cell wall biosynthesis